MATEINKSSLNNILQAVLSLAGQEQSMFFSPKIYSDQRNVIESLLLSALVKTFPSDPTVLDQIAPFVEIVIKPVINGLVELPENYRNILGTPMVFANPQSTGECSAAEEPLTPHTFKVSQLKSGCRLNPLVIVPQSEFAIRTRSTYDLPTWENPIGYFLGKKIKVCPYDISRAAIMYVRKEKKVRFGYITQPDDTYLYDPATTDETEFDSAAFEAIFNASVALYSAYSKNQALQNWSQILSKSGIF